MERTLSFDKLLNFRDVGRFVNSYDSEIRITPGKLYRSARLDEITAADRAKLVNEVGIKTVIDLRSKTEHINALKKHTEAAYVVESPLIPVSNDLVAKPLRIPGLNYAEINLNGKGFERALVWQLKYRSLARLAILMAAGYRTEGIAVLGKEIMLPKGLIGLGIDTLEHSGPEIKQVFDVFAEESSYPVLIHCTQGKDRTGISVLLVLLMCGVDIKAIIADYRKSESELESEKVERMKEITSIGLDESFARCPDDFCDRIKLHLDENYGGVCQYLERIAVTRDQQNHIREILVAP
jgi:protein-tyrosine phosphatase